MACLPACLIYGVEAIQTSLTGSDVRDARRGLQAATWEETKMMNCKSAFRCVAAAAVASRAAACAGFAVHRLRPVFAAALLALPLFAGLTGGAAAQTAVQCTSANTDGSYSVPSGWALKPSELNDGDKFRLLFVTSTGRSTTAADIATYKSLVS